MRVACFVLLLPLACAASPPPAAPAPPAEHHHELHLPPVGPTVAITLDAKSVDVTMAALPHVATQATFADLFHAAWPGEDPAKLHFDPVGSDGFHPASRAPCAALLTGEQLSHAHIDVVTHDLTFDDGVSLPGCYHVHAVVSVTATR